MKLRFFISLVCAAVLLLNSGCASFHPLASKWELPAECRATCQRLAVAPTKYVFTVNIAAQTAALYKDGWLEKNYVCSTSRVGIGETNGSYCTPRGLHRIAEKVGDGQPAGTIFRDRAVIGYVSDLGVKAGTITTRIMWLDGLEPGFNRGGNVDTHDREIYIHGTGDQNSLGRPASIGCIHLADRDLIPLYDLLPSGTLVWISEH
jgi:hypothetical protein